MPKEKQDLVQVISMSVKESLGDNFESSSSLGGD